MRALWRRHLRFLLALLLGMVAMALAPLRPVDRMLLGGDLFFAGYLAMTAWHVRRVTVADLRLHEGEDDEGGRLVLLLAVGSVLLSLVAVIGTLTGHAGAGDAGVGRPWTALAVASVPLAWATLHMVLAFHYAGCFYTRQQDGEDAGGLDFPGERQPEIGDFIYFSYTLGMTAQTSDVAITSTGLRRIATVHAALSFFFNTVILALAVNLAVTLG